MSRKKFNRSPATPFVPKTSQLDETILINSYVYTDYLKRISTLAQSVFKWHNLPDTMDSRFLEKTLFQDGVACFICDKTLGFMNLRVNDCGALNVYELPLKYRAYSIGYSKTYKADELVIIHNNLLDIPTEYTVNLFAQRLANTERTINVNLNAQKTPILVLCDEKERLSLLNIYKDYTGDVPIIYGNKAFNPDSFKTLKTDAPYLIDKLTQYKENLWNEVLTFLGVNNTPSKKERMVTDEANSNNGEIALNAQSMLITRQKACEEFNKMFNQDISVTIEIDNVDELEQDFFGLDYEDNEGDEHE